MTPQFITSVVVVLVAANVILGAVAYLSLLERKVASWVQDRIGPNRVGPLGLLQPLADGAKFIFKEEYTPPHVERPLFLLAPILAVAPALLGWAVIPWGGYYHSQGFAWPSWLPWIGGQTVGPFTVNFAAAPVNIGVIYILAVSSLAVYGVVVAGYASNNKYSFLGGLRATAQMLSYEIPLALCVLIMILMTGSPRADDIVHLQANGVWFLFQQPLLAVIFFTCGLAETNRAPFDLAEAEQELVGGYHTEYASMKLALFLMSEYMHIITSLGFLTILFLGGWDLPIVQEPVVATSAWWVLLKIAVFAGKIFALIFLVMMVRWTLPRFRFDQLMRLAWRSLIPMTLVVLLATGALIYLERIGTIEKASWWMFLLANLIVAAGALVIGPMIPQGPAVNRKVALPGSRFNPA